MEYNPRSRIIVSQSSPFLNGNAMFKAKSIDDVIPQLIHREWEIKSDG